MNLASGPRRRRRPSRRLRTGQSVLFVGRRVIGMKTQIVHPTRRPCARSRLCGDLPRLVATLGCLVETRLLGPRAVLVSRSRMALRRAENLLSLTLALVWVHHEARLHIRWVPFPQFLKFLMLKTFRADSLMRRLRRSRIILDGNSHMVVLW